MNQHLCDLWKIEPIQRQKSIKLLSKICTNILCDPSNTKYHDLNFEKIKKKLNECESAIALLFDIGFKLSINKTRLKWECNDVTLNSMLNLTQNIEQKAHTELCQPTEKISYASTRPTEFVPDFNFNVTREDINSDSSKHILYSSNIRVNEANDHICDISICWPLRRIAKILKEYHLYIQSQEKQNAVIELMEFGYEMNEIKAAIALSHENEKEHKIENEICFENVYGTNDKNYSNTDLINDFNHLLFKHSNEFEAIYNELRIIYNAKMCDLLKCHLLRRNRRNREHENYLNILYFSDDIVSQQLLDAIHCFYFHSFDIGLRLTNKERTDIINKIIAFDDEKTSNPSICDINISQINSIIKSKQKQCKMIEALNYNNKTHKFKPVSLNNYSYGFKFYYWTNAQRLGMDEWEYSVYWDGYDYGQTTGQTHLLSETPGDYINHKKYLYVQKKYETFKEEMILNKVQSISKEQWSNLVKIANIYCTSDYVKAMKCFRNRSAMCYDMQWRDKMLISHVIAMRMYTSNDVLQQKFSETFRPKDNKETLKDLAERHENFYWFARRLRETVECFGTNVRRKAIRVFRGVGKQFLFPTIYPYVNGPFSTSTDYCVATNFCGGVGMILELSIDPCKWFMRFGNMNNSNGKVILPCMDMQWVSEYPNEQELFCMGGQRQFAFDSIIEASTGYNYVTYICGLKIALRGTHTHGNDTGTTNFANNTEKNQQIAFRLLSDEIHRYFPNHPNAYQFKSCPYYIRTMMQTHCNNVSQVQLMNSGNVIMNYFFIDKKTHCVNLDLLTKIFPNVFRLTLQALDYLNRVNDVPTYFRIIQNILDFIIRNNNQSLSLRGIVITYDPKYNTEMSCYLEKVKDIFEPYSWSIRIQTHSMNTDQKRGWQKTRTAWLNRFGSIEKAMQTEEVREILGNLGISGSKLQHYLSSASDWTGIYIEKKE